MKIPNPKSYSDAEWAEIVKEQGGFWNSMNQMIEVHLVETAEMILDQREQSLVVDAIGDTMSKIEVLKTLLEYFQDVDSLATRDSEVKDTVNDINALRASMNATSVDVVEGAVREMYARSQIKKEDEAQ